MAPPRSPQSNKSGVSVSETFRNGFASMLKEMASSTVYFDVKSKPHLECAARLYLDSVDKENELFPARATHYGDREALIHSLVQWALTHPQALKAHIATSKKTFFGTLRFRRKSKSGKHRVVGSVIQHVNKKKVLNDRGGVHKATSNGFEVVNSSSTLDTNVSEVTDYTYELSMDGSGANTFSSFDISSGPEGRNEDRNDSAKRMSMIPESNRSAETDDRGVEMTFGYKM